MATAATSSDAELLGRFVAAFRRGIEREVAAMRTSQDAFEIALGRGEALDAVRYSFGLPEPSDRLAAGVDAPPLRPGVLLAGDRSQSDACHLLNVSLSRARGKLIVVADVGHFERCAPGGIVSQILREAG